MKSIFRFIASVLLGGSLLLMQESLVAGQSVRNQNNGPESRKQDKKALSPTEQTRSGVVVFNNTLNYLGRYFYSPNEFGDQIQLSAEITNRLFLRFQLEYYLSDNASSNETLRIRFYFNDGTNNTPGKLLYEMANPVRLTKGFNSVVIEGLPLQMPDTFTWTAKFEGVDPGEQVGLLFYNPPSIGVAYDDYWENTNSNWVLKKVSGVPANFGMLVMAISAGAPPPELPLPPPPDITPNPYPIP
ncbi:MAG TPA: hypothetical protein P5186_18535 [Candidatus Paceibacterota bacterium]|nr:hypothetical protein [Candidatus Paceibacterota bacterium]HSA01193.1 hypothetical protein [Candidatus Paceibacterota bacterium]